MDVESYPLGIALAVEEAYDRYQLPVMITENGLADWNDTMRPDFIRCHVSALQAAAQTYPVIGYLNWSLTDNFEWNGSYIVVFCV
jgi:beta-glucosidase/6-phospho-beta-glucosidase/beta-galactosidase